MELCHPQAMDRLPQVSPLLFCIPWSLQSKLHSGLDLVTTFASTTTVTHQMRGMLRRGRPATTASVGSPRLALLWHQGDVSQQMLMLALGLGESDHDLFLLPRLIRVPHTQQTIANVLCLSALQGHASFLDSCLTYSVHSSRLTTVLCFVFVFVSEVVSHVTRAGLDPPAATLEVLRL